METAKDFRENAKTLFGSLKSKASNFIGAQYAEKIIELEKQIGELRELHALEKADLQAKIDAKMPSGDHAKDIFDIHAWLLQYAQWLGSKKMNYDQSLNTTDKTIAKEIKEAHKELFRLINNIEDLYKLRKAEAPTEAEFIEKSLVEDLVAEEMKRDEEERRRKSGR